MVTVHGRVVPSSNDSYSALAVGTSCRARERTTSSMDRRGGFLSCSPGTRPKMKRELWLEGLLHGIVSENLVRVKVDISYH